MPEEAHEVGESAGSKRQEGDGGIMPACDTEHGKEREGIAEQGVAFDGDVNRENEVSTHWSASLSPCMFSSCCVLVMEGVAYIGGVDMGVRLSVRSSHSP